MDHVPALLTSIAALLWPAAFILLLVVFRPTLAALIDSAKSRRFTLKIAGQELTMAEINDQQRALIADLQARVVEIRKRLDVSGPVVAHMVEPNRPASLERPKAIPKELNVLWVDDQPKNNSYFAQQLADVGAKVDFSISTADALRRLERGRYTAVISDMGREENGQYNATSGLDLLRALGERKLALPTVIFSSSRAAREHGEEARSLGATAVTSSPTELFGVLRLEERKAT